MEEERSSSSSSSLLNLLRESNKRDETKEDQSLTDDMIFQILLRLQGKSIFKFKCVSKTLNTSILSNPLFHHNYFMQKQQEKAIAASPLTLLGFFYQHLCEEEYGNRDQSREISFLPMCKQGVPIASRGFKQSLGNFIASSNGLVLYGHHPMNYYLCNPITKTGLHFLHLLMHITSKNLVGFYCQEVDDDQH
ncbi:F-box protein At5g03970-like [Fagus crenata]